MSGIFRKAALDRLSSPEQLDKQIKITSPMLWLAAGGVMLALVAVVIWGCFGSLPEKADISGILMQDGYYQGIYAESSGVVEMYVQDGDSVHKGDVVAQIKAEDVEKKISDMESVISGIEAITLTSKNDTSLSEASALLEIKQGYNGEERLHDLLNQCQDLSAENLLYKVKESLDEFVQDAPQFDDITMLAFCYQGNNGENISTERFPSNIEEMSRVIDFVEENLRNNDVPEKAITQINIIVDELASNVLRYSGSDYLEVSCSVMENTIKLQFKDSGVEYNPLNRPEADTSLSAEDRPIGGLGLFMVQKMASSVEYAYEDQCNILTVQYNFA